MGTLPLSRPVFAVLSALVEEKIGIHYNAADADLFATKLSPRVVEAGFDSMMDYYYFLRYDPRGAAEIDEMIDALVVHETYFFREVDQLQMLVRDILPGLIASGRRPRIWSAACASGEEPLTLAMLLARAGLLDRVEIIASDLSARALEQARRGEYGPRSLRKVPDWPTGAWLTIVGDRARVAPEITRSIRWERVNLVDPVALGALGPLDAIICRNVMIYFSDETTIRVIGQLARLLVPGGVLLVGASESLLRFASPLVCEEKSGAFLYRKAAHP